MQNLIRTVVLLLAVSLIAGCSYFGVYKRDIPQGNLITQDMVSQLHPGMSRSQVAYIMGTPLLEAPFSSDQWDYVFYLDEAYGGTVEKRLTLTFQDDQLVDIAKSGDMDSDVELNQDDGPGPAVEGAGESGSVPQIGPSGI
ncbi:MAG: outer membrane assembly protein BamE [Salinicola sp.]|uniref:outer membrane protein assembly factor BamE n=1 Tax=uncultured Salinicola sp. TaxID=1193542 RepID=UPI000C97AD68|nr:outer membrane protein assembly factor BamE [uncultured Salinicola sp.]MAM57199.1 outer membrane assembly protein BamE [Salinicola sp.]|tara:strand:+ start:473 stop:895 length:423 start_codon:yes stop_codon:yes gene_type:complete